MAEIEINLLKLEQILLICYNILKVSWFIFKFEYVADKIFVYELKHYM